MIRTVLVSLMVFVGCASTGEPANGQSPQVDAAPSLGGFRIGMTVAEARSACVAAEAAFVSPNRHRRVRGCRGGHLMVGRTPVRRFAFRLDNAGRIAAIEVFASGEHHVALTRAVVRVGGRITSRDTGSVRGVLFQKSEPGS